MTRNFLLYLTDIAENMREAERFIGSMTFEEFAADRKTAYAVVRCFEIIGEATKNVPDEIQSKRPSTPWSDLARMRDKCMHMYWGINYRIVWDAVKEELPVLLPQIESLLDELRQAEKK
jgi:uncharacterized protein with HEPN domain